MLHKNIIASFGTRRFAAYSGISLAVLAACMPIEGFAQDQTAGVGGLSEVVVSARYREENLQQTPLAITALAGAELEKLATGFQYTEGPLWIPDNGGPSRPGARITKEQPP